MANESQTEKLINEYFAAFNAHDNERLLAVLADDVVHEINEGEKQVGKDAYRKFKTYMDQCYKENISDLCVMTNGNRGAAEFTCSGTYFKTDGTLPEATGQTYSITAAAIFEVKDNLIVRVTSHYNLKGWIKAIL